MNNSRRLLINISIVLAGAIFASGIYLLLSGERGWIKLVAWIIFFAAIQSPFVSSKNGNCSLLARLKKRAESATANRG